MKYDLSAIERIRKPYCEYCGSPAHGWPHHIKTRGAGGKEDPWNLIQLCGECHEAAQTYKIPRRKLIEIVAAREGITVEEIYRKNSWLYEEKLPHEVEVSNPVVGKTFEDILDLYLFCLEKGEQSIWERAAVVTVMNECLKMEPKCIASAVGCSASLVRKFVKVFNAFPKEEDRVPMLSFRHHQIASVTADPKKWLADAADNQWSTRVLQEQIASSGSVVAKKDVAWEKAEKALLLAQETLDAGGDPAKWLREEISKLLGPVALAS